MKTINMIALLALTLTTSLNVYAESGAGNGGSVVVDGTEYKLADLHFKPLAFSSYKIDDELQKQLESIHSALFEIGLNPAKCRGTECIAFFKDLIFSARAEYRLVQKLPESCHFISSENLPAGVKIKNVACTSGSITYIIPEAFSKLTLFDKALLIIHERLHTIAPDEAYEIKCEYIKGIYTLMTRWYPAWKANLSIQLTTDEMQTLDLLYTRSDQLFPYFNPLPVQHFSNGGRFYGLATLDENAKSTFVDVKSTITSVDPNFKIEGSGLKIINSSINGASAILGYESTIKNSTLSASSSLVAYSAQVIDSKINAQWEVNLSPQSLVYRSNIYVSGRLQVNANTSISHVEDLTVSHGKYFTPPGEHDALIIGSINGTPLSIEGRNHFYSKKLKANEVFWIDSENTMNNLWVEYINLTRRSFSKDYSNKSGRLYLIGGGSNGVISLKKTEQDDRLGTVSAGLISNPNSGGMYVGENNGSMKNILSTIEKYKPDFEFPVEAKITWEAICEAYEVQIEVRVRPRAGGSGREVAVVFVYPQTKGDLIDYKEDHNGKSRPSYYTYLLDWVKVEE